MSTWRLSKACLTVREDPRKCSECEEAPISHFVELDLGSQAIAIFSGCEQCTREFATNFAAMLPEVDPDATDDEYIASLAAMRLRIEEQEAASKQEASEVVP